MGPLEAGAFPKKLALPPLPNDGCAGLCCWYCAGTFVAGRGGAAVLEVLLVASMSKKLGLAAELAGGEATALDVGETVAPGADWKSSKSSGKMAPFEPDNPAADKGDSPSRPTGAAVLTAAGGGTGAAAGTSSSSSIENKSTSLALAFGASTGLSAVFRLVVVEERDGTSRLLARRGSRRSSHSPASYSSKSSPPPPPPDREPEPAPPYLSRPSMQEQFVSSADLLITRAKF